MYVFNYGRIPQILIKFYGSKVCKLVYCANKTFFFRPINNALIKRNEKEKLKF